MRIITPEAILSYPNLFTPRAQNDQQEPKYSCALVFTEDTDISDLKKAAVAVAKEKWGAKAADMIKKGQLRMPFRTDTKAKGYPEGSTFMNVRSKQRPGVVSIVPDPETGKPMVIEDESQIYPGVIARASITFFAYDTSGNRGVSAGLNNIQKIREGDRLDSRVRAVDEFEADEDAVADLSDLTDESGDDDGDLDMSDLL